MVLNLGGNPLPSPSLTHPLNGPHIPSSNSVNETLLDNPILTLPSDIAYEILGKIPAPILDSSNPFSILEHCTLAEPTANTSKFKNLIAVQSNMEVTTSNSQALAIVPVSTSNSVNSSSTLAETSHPSIIINQDGYKEGVTPQAANLEVDLSPFKVKVNRKSKNKGSISFGPKT